MLEVRIDLAEDKKTKKEKKKTKKTGKKKITRNRKDLFNELNLYSYIFTAAKIPTVF